MAWVEACLQAIHKDFEAKKENNDKTRGVINISLGTFGCPNQGLYYSEIPKCTFKVIFSV